MVMRIGLPDLWEFLAYEKKQKLDCIKRLFRLCLGERESIRKGDVDCLAGILTEKREVLRELDEIEVTIGRIVELLRVHSSNGIGEVIVQLGEKAILPGDFAEVISLDTEIMALMREVCIIEQENYRTFYDDVEGSAKTSAERSVL